MEIRSSVPPAKLFKAIVAHAETILPQIFPQIITSIVKIEGDGGPGTIHSVDGKHLKERTDSLDKENFAYAYSVVEGDALMNKFAKISYQFRFEACPDGGSVCKSNTRYYPADNAEITEEEIEVRKENSLGMFRIIEAYILANPDVVN